MQRSGIFFSLAASILVGCLVAASLSYAQPAPASTPELSRHEVKPLRDVAVYPQRQAVASVVGRNESKIAAETSGTIVRWSADVGAAVKRGDILVWLDPTDAQLAIDRAQAALDAATARAHLTQAQVKRARELKEQGFLSADALLQRETEAALAQAELASSKAQLATAQRALSKTTIRAPFAGTVKQRMAQVGETVGPGSVLYVLSESRAPELSAAVLPAELPSLRRAKTAVFVALGRSVPATVSRVSSSITLPARTQEVRLQLGKEGADLPVGTEGQLQWTDSQPHLPAHVIVQRGGRLGVFVSEAGRAKFVSLPGAQEGRAAPVHLPMDTLVVTRGAVALQDGQRLSAQ